MLTTEHGITPAMVSLATGGFVAEDDPSIAPAIEEVVATVRRWCGWHVWPVVTETVTLDGTGDRFAQLPTLRLVDVVSVSVSGTVVDDYTWSHRGWLNRRRGGRWPDEDRAIEAVIEHGFDNAPDLRRIICGAVARNASNPMMRSSLQVGQRREDFGALALAPIGTSGLLADDLQILSLYRLPIEL